MENFIDRIVDRLVSTSIIRVIWISVLFAELLTAIIVGSSSIVFNGAITPDYMITGALASLIVSLVVVSIIAMLIKKLQQSQNELSEKDSVYRRVFYDNQAVKLLIDPSTGSIVEANESASKFYGYSLEEFRSKKIWDINTMPEAECRGALLKAERGDFTHFISKHKLASGEIKDIEVNTCKIVAKGKDLMFSIIHDISELVLAEKALQAKSEEYRELFEFNNNILEHSPEGIITLDGKLRITYMNPAMKDILGVPKSEPPKTMSMDITEIPTIIEAGIVSDLENLALGKEFALEIPFKSLYDKKSFISIKAVPIFGDGLFSSAIIIVTDMTERREAEDSMHDAHLMLEKVFASMSDAVLVTDPEKRTFTSCNLALQETFGYTKSEIIGSDTSLLHINKNMCVRFKEDLFATLEKEEMFHTEYQMKRKNGEIFCTEHTATEITDYTGKRIAIVSVIRDITERKDAEANLLEAKDEAVRASRLKDKFVTLVAHDLKTPFTSILGVLKLLVTDEKTPLRKQQKEMLTSAIENGDRLVKMIEELLAITRLQTGSMTPKPAFIDGYVVAMQAISQYSHLAKEKKVMLINEVPQGTRLYADLALYSQVINNLISNAIKYSNAGDEVVVYCAPDESGKILVRDQGVGIKKELLPNIFKHDIKTTSPGTRGETGIGLGLPFSYDIIKAHGGTLTIENKRGDGALFAVQLPYVRPQILVVDDAEVDRIIIMETLRKIDARFIEAKNGKEALEKIKEARPHLVISDVQMDEMNGFELLEHIRLNQDIKSIPMIVITSDNSMETREQAIRLGADDFVNKPLVREDFIPRVRRFVV